MAGIPVRAILNQRCPRCLEGAIFPLPLWRAPLKTYDRCGVCGLKFEREPGYFLGAMYFSYVLSIPPALALVLLIWKLTNAPFDLAVLYAFVAYLPFVPAVSRWSRVLWLHLDQRFDPQK